MPSSDPRVDAEVDLGPLHILRLTPYYYLPGRVLTHKELQYEPVGGMQIQIMQTTEQVSALGALQSVVFPRRPGLRRSMRVDDRTRFELLSLPVAPIPTRSKGYVGLLVSWGLSVSGWCLVQRLRGANRQYSLIHVHCSELPWTWLFAMIAKALFRRPLVLTTHCSAIATFHPETLMGRLLIGPARLFERAAVRRADAVVVLTERVRRIYTEQGLAAPERLHVVPDGVQLAEFRTAHEDVDAAGDQPVVLYCGRFAPEKGWVDYVRAAARLLSAGTQARFVMCGDGNELKHCRALLQELGISDRVDLRGHLERREIAQVMRQACVVVIPSRHEEMGGTVLEALAAGRSVVVTDVGGLPTVVGHGEAGIVVPACDPPALAAAIRRCLESPELRIRFGAAGSRQASAYDLETVTRQLMRVYNTVLQRPVVALASHRRRRALVPGARSRRASAPAGTALTSNRS